MAGGEHGRHLHQRHWHWCRGRNALLTAGIPAALLAFMLALALLHAYSGGGGGGGGGRGHGTDSGPNLPQLHGHARTGAATPLVPGTSSNENRLRRTATSGGGGGGGGRNTLSVLSSALFLMQPAHWRQPEEMVPEVAPAAASAREDPRHQLGLFVSSRPDRLYALPLHGRQFDSDSRIFVYFGTAWLGMVAPPGPTPYNFSQPTQALFWLDGKLQGGALRSIGPPFDFMGALSGSLGKTGMANAAPLHTSLLNEGMHTLRVKVVIDGEDTGEAQVVLDSSASFEVLKRTPQVFVGAVAWLPVHHPFMSHFLDHYHRRLGVPLANFALVLAVDVVADEAEMERARELEATLKEKGIRAVHILAAKRTQPLLPDEVLESLLSGMTILHQDWVIRASPSRYVYIPDVGMSAFLYGCHMRGSEVIFAEMHDRVAWDTGFQTEVQPLDPNDVEGTALDAQFPGECSITKAEASQSIVLAIHRGNILPAYDAMELASAYSFSRTIVASTDWIKVEPRLIHAEMFEWTMSFWDHLKSQRAHTSPELGVYLKLIPQGYLHDRKLTQAFKLDQSYNCSASERGPCLQRLSTSPCKDKVELPRRFEGPRSYTVSDPTINGLAASLSSRLWAWAEEYTVVMMSYSPARKKNQLRLLQHMGNMPGVHKVVFLWNGAPADMPQPLPATYAPIVALQQAKNSLNNRYNPALPIETNAVLILDDDIVLPPSTIASLFARWSIDRRHLVGVEGRIILDKTYVFPSTCCKMFDENLKAKEMRQRIPSMNDFCDSHSIVLPKAMFMDRKYMRMYFSEEFVGLRRYVDEQAGHCDDIALNLMVGNVTGLPPVVQAELWGELASGREVGLTMSNDRDELRQECTAWILHHYPLDPARSLDASAGEGGEGEGGERAESAPRAAPAESGGGLEPPLGQIEYGQFHLHQQKQRRARRYHASYQHYGRTCMPSFPV